MTIVAFPFRILLTASILGCGSTRPQPREDATALPDSTHDASATLRAGPALEHGLPSDSVLLACSRAADFLASWPRARVTFDSTFNLSSRYAGPKSRLGCRVLGAGTTRAASASLDSLIARYRSAGWDWAGAFAADGPDGSTTALQRHSITCVFEGQWDGGDDADSTHTPSDSLALSTACAPLVASDTQ